MKVPFVDLVAQARRDRDDYIDAFAQLLATGAFVGGAAVTEFEEAFAKYTGARHAVSVKTGTDALVLALRVFGIGPGDEVIAPANSFFATAEAISLVGATPVLCDVRDETLLIDPADAEKRITAKTRAIIPVHLFGQVADMVAVGLLAKAHNLRVIEDAAQAHGAKRIGANGAVWTAGGVAEAGCFSFYPTKNLGAFGEGGAVTTHDAGVALRLQQLRDHGQAGRHDHVAIGYNARLDALQCACLAISLRRLDERNAARRRIAEHYLELLATVRGVRIVAEANGSTPVYHLFVVRVDPKRRDAVRDQMASRGIATAIHYPRPIHLQRAYASLGQGPGSCPVAERAATEMISLPMYPDLTEDQVSAVVDALAAALA